MKKLLIPLLLVGAFLGAGLWFLVRRGPSIAPPDDTPATLQVESVSGGILYRQPEGQTPLRALRWLPPCSDGHQVVQIVSQNDRQRVVIFKEDQPLLDAVIPRPTGVREGFFHFAELGEALIADDAVVLLYRSSTGSAEELPLIIALDLNAGTVRWVHRGIGDRIALTPPAKERAVLLFGTSSPVQRLPLQLQTGERTGEVPMRKIAKVIELPEEIKALGDLIATSTHGLLVAHEAGLSSHSPQGWKHWPMPEKDPLAFADARPVLCNAKGFWWQPFPGRLVKVKADGEPTGDAQLPEPLAPWKLDRTLLKLVGGESDGHLWFALAMPILSSPIATPQPPPTTPEGDTQAAPAAPSETPIDWTAYLAAGLDRYYRWSPDRRTLQVLEVPTAWAALAVPNGLAKPAAFPAPVPAARAILIESGTSAWRCSLERLLIPGS